jgi:predicted nucleotidyltransferase
VQEAYIFGSRARQDHRPDSGLDIALVIRPDEGDTSAYATWIDESEDSRDELQTILPYTVDLQQLDGDATPRTKAGVERARDQRKSISTHGHRLDACF